MRYLLFTALIVLALALIFDFGATTTLAQCVMCRASLGNNSSFIRNFNIGVLVLLVPPVSIFCTIFIVAMRYRRSG
jgi:purine-cytosine permease-like protein